MLHSETGTIKLNAIIVVNVDKIQVSYYDFYFDMYFPLEHFIVYCYFIIIVIYCISNSFFVGFPPIKQQIVFHVNIFAVTLKALY